LTEDALARLRGAYQPADQLLVHDWGDATAVVFVQGTHVTLLVDATAAALVADWTQPVDADEADAVARLLESQIPALVQAGILIPRTA